MKKTSKLIWSCIFFPAFPASLQCPHGSWTASLRTALFLLERGQRFCYKFSVRELQNRGGNLQASVPHLFSLIPQRLQFFPLKSPYCSPIHAKNVINILKSTFPLKKQNVSIRLYFLFPEDALLLFYKCLVSNIPFKN